MNVGILITSISNFGKKGYYNSQEIGLAKAFSPIVDKVDVYKLTAFEEDSNAKDEQLEGYTNVIVHYIPARHFGINGFLNTNKLDNALDVLIHFSDTQFSVPKVYKWCKKNDVYYVPYIGVVESHSTSKIKQLITNVMFQRNLGIYKRVTCYVKTPIVGKRLSELGVRRTTVTPVGLDLSLANCRYQEINKNEIKAKFGYLETEHVILYIGRFIEEKRPLETVQTFHNVYKKDPSYRLLMVGSGSLKDDVVKLITSLDLKSVVTLADSIPNSEILELYCLSDCFMNMNKQEIFGMAILEAMYYGCTVVARSAPGPNLIIENSVSGWLANTDEEICSAILMNSDFSVEAHKRILDKFTWESTAQKMKVVIEEKL